MPRMAILLVPALVLMVSCADGPYERRLVSHSDQYHVVRTDPDDRVAAERNMHPIQIELYKVRGVLSDCHYSYRLYGEWSDPLTVLTPEQIDDVAPRIWEALKTAGPYERIAFATSRVPFGLVRDDGDLTEGWIYLAADRWHVGFTVLNGHPFADPRERRTIDSGEDRFLWEMRPLPGQRFYVDRAGDERRDAMEVPLGWPDVPESAVPGWRGLRPWGGYRLRYHHDTSDPTETPADRYWEREYLWDEGR